MLESVDTEYGGGARPSRTWQRRALHPRRRVHRVPEDGELGQLGADQSAHYWSRVHAHTDHSRLTVVRHDDRLGAAQKGLQP